jgi:pyruvate/2-oxoglutarate dehydrogenase complex dihydrolipoamide dehydrogenase (E3) component
LGVQVRLRTEATAESIQALQPDVVFLATGGILNAPAVEGDQNRVVTTPQLHKRVKPWLLLFGERFLGWATHFWLPLGRSVVVIGAGLHGLELAEFLVKRRRIVTVVEPMEKIGEGMIDFRLGLALDWFERKRVKIITGAKDLTTTKRGLAYKDVDGKEREIQAHNVMPTAPLLPNDELFRALEGKVPELYLIGDGKQAGMMVHAVRAGYRTAKTV